MPCAEGYEIRGAGHIPRPEVGEQTRSKIFVNKKSHNAKKHVSECPQTLSAIFLDNIPKKLKFTKKNRFSGFFKMLNILFENLIPCVIFSKVGDSLRAHQ